MTEVQSDKIRSAVLKQYSSVATAGALHCCGTESSCCSSTPFDPKHISMELGYLETDVDQVPEGSNMGLGCGNPGAIASLELGETVLDLGSGAGVDCFLAAQKVGTSGQVIGVDMTVDMLSKARIFARSSGYENVEFRLGEIEHLPVADEVVDVIISNCVVNLSPEKSKVFQEAFRVLKPGGRLAISDIVLTARLPENIKNNMQSFTSCISGAVATCDIVNMLKESGFVEIDIRLKDESKKSIRNWIPGSNSEDYVSSATIEALKPRS